MTGARRTITNVASDTPPPMAFEGYLEFSSSTNMQMRDVATDGTHIYAVGVRYNAQREGILLKLDLSLNIVAEKYFYGAGDALGGALETVMIGSNGDLYCTGNVLASTYWCGLVARFDTDLNFVAGRYLRPDANTSGSDRFTSNAVESASSIYFTASNPSSNKCWLMSCPFDLSAITVRGTYSFGASEANAIFIQGGNYYLGGYGWFIMIDAAYNVVTAVQNTPAGRPNCLIDTGSGLFMHGSMTSSTSKSFLYDYSMVEQRNSLLTWSATPANIGAIRGLHKNGKVYSTLEDTLAANKGRPSVMVTDLSDLSVERVYGLYPASNPNQQNYAEGIVELPNGLFAVAASFQPTGSGSQKAVVYTLDLSKTYADSEAECNSDADLRMSATPSQGSTVSSALSVSTAADGSTQGSVALSEITPSVTKVGPCPWVSA